MWNQPYFNQPPMGANPFGGGYIYVPVQAPTSQVGMPTPPLPRMKKKTLRKQIKEAEDTIEAVKSHVEWLKKNGDGKKDEKKEDKKEGGGSFNLFQQSVLLLLTVPFLTLCEIYAYKQMVKPG